MGFTVHITESNSPKVYRHTNSIANGHDLMTQLGGPGSECASKRCCTLVPPLTDHPGGKVIKNKPDRQPKVLVSCPESVADSLHACGYS